MVKPFVKNGVKTSVASSCTNKEIYKSALVYLHVSVICSLENVICGECNN